MTAVGKKKKNFQIISLKRFSNQVEIFYTIIKTHTDSYIGERILQFVGNKIVIFQSKIIKIKIHIRTHSGGQTMSKFC